MKNNSTKSTCHGDKTDYAGAVMLFVLVLVFPPAIKAQPGWYDESLRYFYTILDKKGNEISFRNSAEYTIRVNNVLYASPDIPADSLRQVSTNERIFYNYIRVNDLSLCLPQDNRRNRFVEIQVIHKKDTLFLNQPTGNRNFWRYGISANTGREEIWADSASDISLYFIPGHYYFPEWARPLYQNLPALTGAPQIVNNRQQNFIISPGLYARLSLPGNQYKLKHRAMEMADEEVTANFSNGFFKVEKRTEPTALTPSLAPYKNPYWSSEFNATSDKDIFTGLVNYTRETNNYNKTLQVFSIYNKKTNTITHWLPEKNPDKFSTIYLYADTFNKVLYNATVINDTCRNIYDCNFTWKFFRSENEGKTWTEEKTHAKLFERDFYAKPKFLDKEHMLFFAFREIIHPVHNYKMKQGGYYLVKNGRLIDSLITPGDVNYNTNYAGYQFNRVGDTVLLGAWGINEQDYYGTAYFQPMLVKQNGEWLFRVMQQQFTRQGETAAAENTETRYQNFSLVNRAELVFNNGAGKMKIKSPLVELPGQDGIFIIEQNRHIYLVNNVYEYTLLSFNGGASWYIYPRALDNKYDYQFLETNSKNEVSFFKRRPLQQVFYKFTRVKNTPKNKTALLRPYFNIQ